MYLEQMGNKAQKEVELKSRPVRMKAHDRGEWNVVNLV